MNELDKYKALLSDIIAKQIAILGPDIALLKARAISGIEVSDEGTVMSISGDPKKVLEKLVDEYVQLSGQIVKSTLSSVFDKYPDLKKDAH